MSRSASSMVPVKVFLSHGSHDAWVARRMARCIGDCGASVFIDVYDIATGDEFGPRIRTEISQATEIVALFTPFSTHRAWVWAELGAAWVLGKRLVGVTYGVTVEELERTGGGKGVLEGLVVRGLNAFDACLQELSERVGA